MKNVGGQPRKAESYLNTLFYVYRFGAGKRKHEFTLTPAEFKEVITQNCAYCASSPVDLPNFFPAVKGGRFAHNGVDRVDNTLGYVSGNCVAACKKCNLMKGKLPYSEFMEQVRRVYENTRT